MLVTCLALTWLNPHVYLDTVVLLGTLANEHSDERWLFGVGAVTASVVWFVSLGLGARRLSGLFATPIDLAHPRRDHRRHNDRTRRVAGRVLRQSPDGGDVLTSTSSSYGEAPPI